MTDETPAHPAGNVPAMAKMMIEKKPVLFGGATIENAFDKVAVVDVLTPKEIIEKEPELQKKAKQLLPRLFFDQIDVLVMNMEVVAGPYEWVFDKHGQLF
ncbi:hypothetical protein A5418_13050 [Geobacillus subterraneus]|nr:hypothetical protein A5418_13050 [Geobacillus subterraneus]